MSGCRLSVVMPVYNEAAGIAQVLDDIAEHVWSIVDDAEVVVVDDGSTDGTTAIVAERAASDPRVRLIVNASNAGHGPSVRRAIDASVGDWFLHVDSDGQVELSEFASLWEVREHSDLVLGVRSRRQDPTHRLVLTRLTRWLVSALAGRRIRDANTPFKLVRRTLFDHLAPSIDPSAFAPSILIVLGAHRAGAVVTDVATTHLPRRHGRSTLRLGRLARAVALSTSQTFRFRFAPVTPYERSTAP